MRWTTRIFAAALCAALQACVTPPLSGPRPPVAAEVRSPVTILISIDAFRPDYLRRGDTPNLDALAASGVTATMRPSFPTLTFPNHNTLVTGMRPDHHGIVANTFYDPAKPDVKFYNKDQSSADPFWWAEAEPLWITAEKAGIRSATMFWPGEEAAHGDVRPSDWARFDPNFTSAQRVLTVEDWMRRPPAIRPKFVTLYFDDVDKAGHKHGPWGADTILAVRGIDRLIGDLRATLAALGQPVTFVIVSDHGMRNVEPAKAVLLQTLLPNDLYTLIFYGPTAAIAPKPGHEEEVARILTAPNPLMTCWRKTDIPAALAYGKNPRVAPILCQSVRGGDVLQGAPTNMGEHGYDMDDPEMAALFLVNGPGIRTGARIPAKFDNVDLYPLLAKLIGVMPLPSDGNPATLGAVLAAR